MSWPKFWPWRIEAEQQCACMRKLEPPTTAKANFDIRHTHSRHCTSTHHSNSSTPDAQDSLRNTNDRKHASYSAITTALARIIGQQVATFSRLLRPATTGRAITTLKHTHHNRKRCTRQLQRQHLTVSRTFLLPKSSNYQPLPRSAKPSTNMQKYTHGRRSSPSVASWYPSSTLTLRYKFDKPSMASSSWAIASAYISV